MYKRDPTKQVYSGVVGRKGDQDITQESAGAAKRRTSHPLSSAPPAFLRSEISPRVFFPLLISPARDGDSGPGRRRKFLDPIRRAARQMRGVKAKFKFASSFIANSFSITRLE